MTSTPRLVCTAFALVLLAACGDRGGTPPAPASAPAASSPAPSSGDHPSQPSPGQNSNPTTQAPAPGSGEGASAATDPSQKK
ncbi:hypothetical protein [Xylophilus sp. GOD-11R]|uniref:hypothetical protein n=1 Tax=Xylophilus sp. GOD-11R TaxID=3089814 RepID=UPI00298BDD7B|nr:hypothetical protein [Xylophilus sp. GOD-11R]WPB57645.1 hypothetical protein R9X41_03050 [Xylophilus sp. GOD-11R]